MNIFIIIFLIKPLYSYFSVKKGWPQGSPSSSGSVSPMILTADPSPSKIGSSGKPFPLRCGA